METTTRIPVSTTLLPGFTSARAFAGRNEDARARVYGPDRRCIGDVVYTRRRLTAGGTEYGWRPAGSPRAKLTTKVDAIRRLPAFPKENPAR